MQITTQEYESLKAEITRLKKIIQDYLDGNFGPRVGKHDKCPHGLYGYEICGQCIDEHFAAEIGHQQRPTEGTPDVR